MDKYSALSMIRDEYIEGVGPWHWPSRDDGAWGRRNSDGPIHEFPQIRDLILRSVKKQGIIVQAGGCCGMYPRLFAEHFEWVWTFEPCPFNFYHLALNCQKDNIFKFQAALSDTRGPLKLVRSSPENVGMHELAREGYEGHFIPVQSVRVDDLGLEDCSAIQLDVEGAEDFALRGAIETIDKFRPVISLERVSDWAREFLYQRGYNQVGQVAPDIVWKVD
jgi:FkbM family methyltransferase